MVKIRVQWILILVGVALTAMVAGCEMSSMDNQGTISLDELEGIVPEPGDEENVWEPGSDGFPAEIDTSIKWLHTDVSRWPVTTTVKVSFSGDKIQFPYGKAKTWRSVDGVNANPWVIAKVGGQWYAATFEWLRFGQTVKPKHTVRGDHTKASPLSGGWAPQKGDRVGIFVSGLARAKSRNHQERSNVVMVTWP